MRLEITLNCNDIERMADFWSAALGYLREPQVAEGYVSLGPRDRSGPTLTLQRVPEPKTAKNRMHLDMLVEDFDSELTRLESLGASRVTPAPMEAYGQRWFVLADPEGNEFCLAPLPETG